MGAGGTTAAELAKGLGYGSMTKEEVSDSLAKSMQGTGNLLKIANKVFLNKGYQVSDTFSKLSRSFDSGAESLDFGKSSESEQTINNWVEKETNGKIKNLLSPGTIDGDTSALLVNAIYFKGEWESPFPHMNTRKMEFYSTSGKGVQTDFMYDDDYFNYGELEDLDATAVEMKYKNGDFSMLIILPTQKSSLKQLASKLQSNYNLIGVSEKLSSRKIDIYIPKFEMEYELDLNQPLSKMGIETMFTNKADFHDLFKAPAPAVKISKAFHKAVIKVDEAGSEAAAATCEFQWHFTFYIYNYNGSHFISDLKAYPMSLTLDQRTFKADRPFLWVIKDSNNIFFLGQVTKF